MVSSFVFVVYSWTEHTLNKYSKCNLLPIIVKENYHCIYDYCKGRVCFSLSAPLCICSEAENKRLTRVNDTSWMSPHIFSQLCVNRILIIHIFHIVLLGFLNTSSSLLVVCLFINFSLTFVIIVIASSIIIQDYYFISFCLFFCQICWALTRQLCAYLIDWLAVFVQCKQIEMFIGFRLHWS